MYFRSWTQLWQEVLYGVHCPPSQHCENTKTKWTTFSIMGFHSSYRPTAGVKQGKNEGAISWSLLVFRVSTTNSEFFCSLFSPSHRHPPPKKPLIFVHIALNLKSAFLVSFCFCFWHRLNPLQTQGLEIIPAVLIAISRSLICHLCSG